ncbi:hypothetical protein BU24DRAFT_358398, partial [Aaosphaeria arxii CBS 175.79]
FPAMTSRKPSQHLVIFCDGTWCGRETGTRSNIRILADLLGVIDFSVNPPGKPALVHPIITPQTNVIAGYQEGVGLNKSFLEYLWDGATASTIGDECTAVYKFIVDNYTDDHDIWMFGFSRGAFTIRCVAGMINNCGIIMKLPDLSDNEVYTLCSGVYSTYRSPLEIDKPNSTRCRRLREDKNRVWYPARPIRAMILLDTVGSLGIPRLNAGVGFDWPEFYDQRVSSVVQEVYHAPSLHDRLWMFQPCLAFTGPGKEKASIHQTWFPGCHYDVGRQNFRFIRGKPRNWLERWLGTVPRELSKTIYANEILSDVTLRWMLEAVLKTHKKDGSLPIFPRLEDNIDDINQRIADPALAESDHPTGSGDIYGDLLDYAPAGLVWRALARVGAVFIRLLNQVVPGLGDNILDLLGIKTIIKILTATRDRRIPGNMANVYPYKSLENVLVRNTRDVTFTVEDAAGLRELNEDGKVRYPSQTYESFVLWKRVFSA